MSATVQERTLVSAEELKSLAETVRQNHEEAARLMNQAAELRAIRSLDLSLALHAYKHRLVEIEASSWQNRDHGTTQAWMPYFYTQGADRKLVCRAIRRGLVTDVDLSKPGDPRLVLTVPGDTKNEWLVEVSNIVSIRDLT